MRREGVSKMVPLLIALGLALGGVVAFAFWDQIKEWLSDLIVQIRSAFNRAAHYIKHAARVLGSAIRNAIAKIKHQLYYQEEGQWFVKTTTAEISEDEVPPEIMAQINNQENVNITDTMSRELQMEI